MRWRWANHSPKLVPLGKCMNGYKKLTELGSSLLPLALWDHPKVANFIANILPHKLLPFMLSVDLRVTPCSLKWTNPKQLAFPLQQGYSDESIIHLAKGGKRSSQPFYLRIFWHVVHENQDEIFPLDKPAPAPPSALHIESITHLPFSYRVAFLAESFLYCILKQQILTILSIYWESWRQWEWSLPKHFPIFIGIPNRLQFDSYLHQFALLYNSFDIIFSIQLFWFYLHIVDPISR